MLRKDKFLMQLKYFVNGQREAKATFVHKKPLPFPEGVLDFALGI